jgi:hypothetical protein
MLSCAEGMDRVASDMGSVVEGGGKVRFVFEFTLFLFNRGSTRQRHLFYSSFFFQRLFFPPPL